MTLYLEKNLKFACGSVCPLYQLLFTCLPLYVQKKRRKNQIKIKFYKEWRTEKKITK